MTEMINDAPKEFDFGLIDTAVEGAAHKQQDPSEAARMAVGAAKRHPNFHALSDTVYEQLVHPMDSVPSAEYRKGVIDALRMPELSRSELDSLREVREQFPAGI